MTRDHVEALEERLSELGSLVEVIRVLEASTALDADATDVLHVARSQMLGIVGRLDPLAVAARAMLEDRA